MKDEELTNNCTQVFTALLCQPRSVSISIGGQNYLLSPGDHFFVPAATSYRICNHSETTDAEISFVVIKQDVGMD